MTEPTTLRPADVFFHLIVTYLTPLFLAAAGGDVAFARLAAIETVNGYGARSITDLLPIAQVIAFGLAILDSLSRSMSDTISLPHILRLRSGATSMNRASETCCRVLDAPPLGDTEPAPHEDPPPPIQAPVPAPQPPAPPTQDQPRNPWAASATRVAAEFTASIPKLPPSQRRAASLRASILSGVAHDLLNGVPGPTLFNLKPPIPPA